MKANRYYIFLSLFLVFSIVSLSAQELAITNITTTPTTCSDGTDGTISFDISGGTSPYEWFIYEGIGLPVDFGGPTASTSITSVGRRKLALYRIGVKDAAGTSVTMTTSVDGPEPMQITGLVSIDITCNNDNDGSITVTATGESGSPVFDLNGPLTITDNTTGFFSGLPGGTYTVTARDGGSCLSTDISSPVSIIDPPPINMTIDLVTNVACNGESTGSIEITPTGGTPNYSYNWTGPNGFSETTEDISGLAVGDYTLTITDANGCIMAFPAISITENAPIAASFDVTDLTCGPPLPSNNGAIDATITGGSGTYSFAWTGPNGFTTDTEDISGLEAGPYVLEVSDDEACVETFPAQVVGSPPLLFASATHVDISCFGDANGSIDLTVSGGTSPYTFAWTGPSGFTATTEDLSDLDAGAYSVTISYSGICSIPFSNIATITEPPEIQASSVKTDISCGGLTDGAIDLTVTGGVGPYTFAWTGPSGFTATTEDISGLAAGSYSVTVTDATLCALTFTDQETIIEPSSVVVSNVTPQDVLCNGEASGSIDIDVSGGVAPYSYSWSNSSGTNVSDIEDPVDLPADTYSLAIMDANGCTFNFPDLATIAEPPVLTASLSKTDISCFGDGNGSITVAAAGGTEPYEYSSDGANYQTGASFGALGPGFYTILTRDANLCVVTDTITILEPAEIQIQIETATYRCYGNLQGEISINGVTGGVGPYTYSIDGGSNFSSSNFFTGLAPGSYQTVVMDASGCMVNGNLNVLVEPPPLQIVSYSQDNVSLCFDNSDGRIQISGTGGTGIIQYSLDGAPPVSQGDFQNLTGGTYIISLVDSNGCTHDTTVVILTPPVLSIDNITITDVSGCGGNTNGALEVTGSGGTGSLEFSLDDVNYQPTGSFIDLAAGDYTVWIRDSNGCTVTAPATINEPAPVDALVVKTDATYGNLGSITISDVSGGTAPYEYSINGMAGPFSSTSSYADLAPASYHVVVLDVNGCIYEEMVQILDVPPLDVVVNVTHVSCFGADDGIIEFVPQDAEGAVQYSINNGADFGSDPIFEDLPGNATYQLVALDEAGKLFTGAVTLTEPAEILFSSIVSLAQCNAFSPTGAIDITVSGGAGSFTYLWSDGNTAEDRSNLNAGIYGLLITDDNNCTRAESVSVGSEDTVNVDAGADVSACPGASVQLQGAGTGTPSWDPSPFLSDENILDPVAAGMTESTDFVLTITETNIYLCYNKDTVRVNLYPEIGLDAGLDTFVIEGNSINLEASGGPFDQYSWQPETGLDNPTIADPIATPVVSTRYYVIALNEYGCEEVDSVLIEVLEDIQAYNVFSPNGDGINEYFEITNSDRFPEMLVEVYSRWGEKLFSTVGYDSGSQWDGTTRGKEAPVGTYYYIIVPYSGAKPITGNVTIIR